MIVLLILNFPVIANFQNYFFTLKTKYLLQYEYLAFRLNNRTVKVYK